MYSEDDFFKPILANPEEFTNFAVRDDLVFFKSEGIETIAIPDVRVDGQSIRELLMGQGHSILAHLVDERTATYLRDQVWWKTMIKEHCRLLPVLSNLRSEQASEGETTWQVQDGACADSPVAIHRCRLRGTVTGID